jgi:hypothetical protein
LSTVGHREEERGRGQKRKRGNLGRCTQGEAHKEKTTWRNKKHEEYLSDVFFAAHELRMKTNTSERNTVSLHITPSSLIVEPQRPCVPFRHRTRSAKFPKNF